MKVFTIIARTYTVSRLRLWREHGGEWPGDGEEVGEGRFHAGLVSSYQFTFLLRLGVSKSVAWRARSTALLRVNFVDTRGVREQ